MLSYTSASSEPEFKLFPSACTAKLTANHPKLFENSMITQETAMQRLLKIMQRFLPHRSAAAPEGISHTMLVAWYIPSKSPICARCSPQYARYNTQIELCMFILERNVWT